MNGGESRTDISIARMFDELKYQSEIKQSSSFPYTTQYVKGVGRYLDTNEQHNILKLMDARGLIRLYIQQRHNNASSGFALIEGEESETTQSLMSTEYVVDVSKVTWPQATNEQVSHTARLNFRDGTVSIGIDGGEFKIAGSVSGGLGSYRLLEGLFSKSVGVVVPSADIFDKRTNLRQIITKNNLDYVIPFLDETALPYAISRSKQEIELTSDELKTLLSKLTEKYRNNFIEYL